MSRWGSPPRSRIRVSTNAPCSGSRSATSRPTFAELADPLTIPSARIAPLVGLDRNEPDSRNLFRVHWFGRLDGSGPHEVPDYIELPSEMTGVEARILLAIGNRFPMIRAHKVLAAYSCLVPRLVTGRFDPTAHRAVWPSTGNYARGGIAISRIMDCRGVAVLPEGMSKARFDWLEQWTLDPANDIIRTPGTESNVKEIYDACNVLEQDPEIEIINQFSEFSNHLGHYAVTGPALGRVFEHATAGRSEARSVAFRLGVRLSRHARRRRLSQGHLRQPDRGGRSTRVSDDAGERLR